MKDPQWMRELYSILQIFLITAVAMFVAAHLVVDDIPAIALFFAGSVLIMAIVIIALWAELRGRKLECDDNP